VVGYGYMGRLHAEKVDRLARRDGSVALAGVADRDPARAREAALRFGVPGVRDARELFAGADAAIVVVPTESHHEVATEALRAGLDVLVEKPFAASVAQGEALLGLADRHGRILQVGHQERFNAALRVTRDRVDRPRYLEAQRLGPFQDRGTDVDVVRDLMIHDLDLVLQIVGEEPERIEAIGVPVLSDHVDVANARVTFPGGCVANLTASRVSATRVRKLRVFQESGYLSVDFLAQSAEAYARRRRDGAAAVEVDKLALEAEDPLLSQLRAFADGVVSRVPRGVSGEEALRALRAALRVVATIADGARLP